MRFAPDRGRLVAVLTSVGCVAAIVLAATVATSTLAPAVAFAQTGHWVVNSAESAVVHVDGGTSQVDARVELPADIGDPLFALQGEKQGFVVAADRIAVFGRSSLTVDSTIPVEFAETPVGIETVGGPYLVYREAGTIVRLGVPPLSLPVGGRLDRPVWTDDGTVWLHRPDNGSFCALRSGADVLDCSVSTAPGEPGGLSVTGELPAFVGTRQDAAQVIATALGSPVGLGADVVDAALLADRDTEGRLALVEPATNRLVLTDSSGVPDGRRGGSPVVVELGPGTFTSPVAAGGVVALLNTAANRLLTYDVSGRLLGSVDLPPGEAAALVRGGDGKIYVDNADGSATHIVGADGSVTTVGTSGVPPDLVAVAAPPGRSSSVIPPRSPSRPPQFGVPASPTPGGGAMRPPIPIGPRPNPGDGRQPIPVPPGPQPTPPVVRPADAPPALTLDELPSENPFYRVSWREPPLNGGNLAYYEFSANDSTGAVLRTTTTAAMTEDLAFDSCLFPVVVTVVAVTREPVTGALLQGVPAVEDTGGSSDRCTVSGQISAVALGDAAVQVTLDLTAGYAYSRGNCTLLFDGVAQWSGECVPASGLREIDVAQLDPGRTYAVELTITSANGRETRSPAVLVTTDPVLPPEPPPVSLVGDINEDGSVDCADVDILNSDWGPAEPGARSDLNDDGEVDITDLSILLSNWTGDEESQRECSS